MSNVTQVNQHYGTEDLIARMRQVLQEAGLSEHPSWEALTPLDQFHVGGAMATADLAARLRIGVGSQLLDVGCGLGGPARHLAASYNCFVKGIDLNARYVDVANFLTGLTRQSDHVHCMQGDAVHLPFEDQSFDFALTQHVAMNIEDRATLYAGILRVLRPGGRLAIYDVVAGDRGPVIFPVPWASDPSTSFLLTADATRAALEAAGFEIADWRDASEDGSQWQQAQVAGMQTRPDHLKPVGLPVVMGKRFPEMVTNLGRNFTEHRARLLQAIVRRPVAVA